MKNLLRVLITMALIATCLVFASCKKNEDSGNASGGYTDLGNYAEIENSYRIRLVYSYAGRTENEQQRPGYNESIITVTSFFVPKDNPAITEELKNEIKSFYFHGYQFENFYEEWDMEEQKPLGNPYSFPDKINSDITLFCDRGDKAGTNITWSVEEIEAEVTDDSTEEEPVKLRLVLTGAGDMYNFLEPNGIDIPWYNYINDITEVVFSSDITSIGDNSFNGFKKLATAELPENLIRIGVASFKGSGITKLRTPEKLEVIELDAFNSTSLKDVILNEGLKILGERAFYGSNRIKSIVFPKSVTTIPIAAFHPGGSGSTNNSHSLSKVYYTGTEAEFARINVNIDNTWFKDQATIYYYKDEPQNGESVVDNYYWRFLTDKDNNKLPAQYCYVIKYVIGGAKTFLCSTLIPVSPEVDGEGNYVLDSTGNIKLRGTVTAEHLKFQNDITYHGYKFEKFSIVGGSTLVIGNEVSSDLTFTCQRGDILSPDGGIRWREEGGTLTIYIDEETLTRITEDVEDRVDSSGKIVLYNDEIEILANHRGISVAELEAKIDANGYITLNEGEKQAIINGRHERSLHIFDFEQTIDTTALWSLNNSTVLIQDGIKHIGKYTFAGISRTRSVNIPGSVKSVHTNAFDGCIDLLYLCYDGIIEDSCPSLIDVDNNIKAVAYSFVEADKFDEVANNIGNFWTNIAISETEYKFLCWSLTSQGALTIGGDEEMVDFATPEDAPWYYVKDAVSSVSFVKNIKTIGENIANAYKNLKAIDIPTGVRYIPATAFENCGMFLVPSNYTDGVIVVNGHLLRAFPSTANKEFVELGYNVETVAGGAFAGCDNIKRLVVTRNIRYIHKEAFPDSDIDIVFVDSDQNFWSSLVMNCEINFGDAQIYYRSNFKPTDTNNTYWYKSGSEYVIWGTFNSDKTEEE